MKGYKCPSCGANLSIDSKSKTLKCPYCGQVFQIDSTKDIKKYATLLAIISVISLLLAFVLFSTLYPAIFFAIVSLVCGLISWIKAKNKVALISIIALLLFIVVIIAELVSAIKNGGVNSPYLQYDETNIENLDHFITPSEESIIDALKGIDGITRVMSATEYHDPNKGLSKNDGYYADIFFEYDKVDSSGLQGSDLVDNGTKAGGSIEIYRNQEDAEKRYKNFSVGRVVSAGGCYKVGTLIIRTSPLLTLEEQEELLGEIIESIDFQTQ